MAQYGPSSAPFTLFSVYHLHKQLCSSLLYSSMTAAHSCICLRAGCVHAHLPQPKHLCVCACYIFYFTFKILTSWIKRFNRRVKTKLFELIDNLKLHTAISIVSLKLVQLMTESNLVPMVYTCNFNTEEGKAGGYRVWGKPGLHRTLSHKTKQNKKSKYLNWLLESWKGVFLLWGLKGCRFEGKAKSNMCILFVFVYWVWFLAELLGL